MLLILQSNRNAKKNIIIKIKVEELNVRWIWIYEDIALWIL